ncbi:hypothetical protein F383_04666 [Gossypium arboreum]|uniref:Uncharacterized protein n=1 Tax=Gossypium arboreum TaxID=29729 RepID=A0A0B0MJK9_GOSAR|nr:hypothetical protein F383_38969 [Gossypium arboreum]KHG21759.1 hypothetical protein F383_04666 [Gossypium arboreum]
MKQRISKNHKNQKRQRKPSVASFCVFFFWHSVTQNFDRR